MRINDHWVMMRSVAIGLVSLLLAHVPAWSQGKTYAVVVGISDYKNLTNQTGDLRFADRDARQVATFLQSPLGGSVPTANLHLLTNAQATRSAIARAMRVFDRATATDRVILYFSGHGLANCFVPYDVLPGSPTSVLPHEVVKQAFRRSKAQVKLCIADACLSGGMTLPVDGLASRPTAPSVQAMASTFTTGTSVAMLLAGRATQLAVEDRRMAGGAFTFFLLKGLAGAADRNANRIVTIRELHQYVSPRVRQHTRGRQSPVFYGNFPDTMALTYL